MHNPLPAGFTIKHPTIDDISVIYGIYVARETFEGRHMDMTESSLRNLWQLPGFDLV